MSNIPPDITAGRPSQAPYGAAKPQTNWIEVSDFSPGIYDDWYNLSGTQPAPDGAAQLTGTFGCCSNPAGGLVPAPRSVKTWQINPSTFDSPVAPNYYLNNDVAVHILAMRVMSPIMRGAASNMPPYTPFDNDADQHFIMFSWFYSSGGTGTNYKQRAKWQTHKFFVNPTTPTTFTMQDVTSTLTTNGKNGLMAHGVGTMDFSRSNKASSTTPGWPVCVGAFATTILGETAMNFQFVYPSNDTPTFDSTDQVGGIVAGTLPYKFTAHQDRFFYTSLSIDAAFGALNALSNVETINATQPNDYSNSASTTGSVFVAENPSGVTSMTSMNASQLFCLKAKGGGFVMAGAFEQPTITRLPGIASGSPPTVPAIQPGGQVVWGNYRGVWGWSGGNQSTRLSPQIDGAFWQDPTTAQYTGNRGRFVYQEPYVFCPNNFLYDVTKKGWWRLNDPTKNVVHSFYDTTASGRVVASPATLTPANWTVYEWFDTLQGTSSYQWISQPFQRTKDRQCVFNELTFVAQGAGTVTFTLSSSVASDHRQPQTLGPITVGSTPKAFTIPCGFNGSDLVVKINATSSDPAQPAPRIYRFAVAFYTDVTEPRT